jgi:4-alpha-glucanotransferase
VTSRPSPFGIGGMGPAAYEFADLLSETEQSVWQILPLSPPREGHFSPYLSPSAFAGNPLLISPELLARDGLISGAEIRNLPDFPRNRVDFDRAAPLKRRFLEIAYRSFRIRSDRRDYERFCTENGGWLDDFALFVALQSKYDNRVWQEWPAELRDRRSSALATAREELKDVIFREKFFQYVFYRQWLSLKEYCNAQGIKIFGDIPIYIDYNSVDVWTHPELFKLDEKKMPTAVSGVPPDYFSETGQLWGHPIYRWEALKATDYQWWIDRIAHNLKLCDLVRIDHFRGFVGYWEVPAGEPTAVNGKWVEGPSMDFFRTVLDRFPNLPLVAEDLGLITKDVSQVMRELDVPGMKVLLFAFGDDTATNPYLPHNLVRNCIAYTGTHDNNTVRGWFEHEASEDEKSRLLNYLGCRVSAAELHWSLVRLLMMSVADTVILPMQDVLGLGAEDRMNKPSVSDGNWRWRLDPNLVTPAIKEKLLSMTKTYGRARTRLLEAPNAE